MPGWEPRPFCSTTVTRVTLLPNNYFSRLQGLSGPQCVDVCVIFVWDTLRSSAWLLKSIAGWSEAPPTQEVYSDMLVSCTHQMLVNCGQSVLKNRVGSAPRSHNLHNSPLQPLATATALRQVIPQAFKLKGKEGDIAVDKVTLNKIWSSPSAISCRLNQPAQLCRPPFWLDLGL
jgi:hypothetical protein